MERLLKYSFPPSFILYPALPCEVYFQEAISIYKADFNLSIDLCFQGSLRKLFAEEGQRILNVFQLKYVPFCVYKNSKLLSNKDICKIFKHTCVDVAFFSLLLQNTFYFSAHHSSGIGTQYSSQFQFCQVCSIKFTVLQNKIPPEILWVWFASVFLVPVPKLGGELTLAGAGCSNVIHSSRP